MAELIVDEKRRITLPKELGARLGITSGSRLEVEQREGEIILKPLVPIKKPTEALWGLARSRGRGSPKKEAREAIVPTGRGCVNSRLRFVETNIFLYAINGPFEFRACR